MKRNDMVLAIASEIVCELPQIPFDIAQIIGEAILNRVQKEGMLPPERYEKFNDFVMAYSDDYARLLDETKTHTWEPENE